MKKRTICVWLAVLLLLTSCAQNAETTWQEQYDLGVRYLSEGNYEEAIIAFNAAIEIDPKRAEAYIGLADAYEAQGDVERARQVLEDVLAVVSDPDMIRSRLAELEEGEAPEPTLEPTPASTDNLADESGPVYLLMRQAGYTPDGVLVQSYMYQYDAQGYILSREEVWYSPYTGSLTKNSITTYEYTGEPGQCRMIPDRQAYESEEKWLAAQQEISVRPGLGTFWGYGSGEGYFIYASPYNVDTLTNDGVLTKEASNTNDSEDWAYAVYTFDDAGNPINIVTYNDADTVVGTATLEWKLLEAADVP